MKVCFKLKFAGRWATEFPEITEWRNAAGFGIKILHSVCVVRDISWKRCFFFGIVSHLSTVHFKALVDLQRFHLNFETAFELELLALSYFYLVPWAAARNRLRVVMILPWFYHGFNAIISIPTEYGKWIISTQKMIKDLNISRSLGWFYFELTKKNSKNCGDFKYCFIFTPTWGNGSIWRAYFLDGLKPPTRKGYVPQLT